MEAVRASVTAPKFDTYVSNFGAVTDARTASTAVFYPGEGRSLFAGLRLAY